MVYTREQVGGAPIGTWEGNLRYLEIEWSPIDGVYTAQIRFIGSGKGLGHDLFLNYPFFGYVGLLHESNFMAVE